MVHSATCRDRSTVCGWPGIPGDLRHEVLVTNWKRMRRADRLADAEPDPRLLRSGDVDIADNAGRHDQPATLDVVEGQQLARQQGCRHGLLDLVGGGVGLDGDLPRDVLDPDPDFHLVIRPLPAGHRHPALGITITGARAY